MTHYSILEVVAFTPQSHSAVGAPRRCCSKDQMERNCEVWSFFEKDATTLNSRCENTVGIYEEEVLVQ